jgi:DNA-binding FrmR family transcriptional regulator
MELMREPIENGRLTGLDRLLESGSDAIKIIQQIECDAIKAD